MEQQPQHRRGESSQFQSSHRRLLISLDHLSTRNDVERLGAAASGGGKYQNQPWQHTEEDEEDTGGILDSSAYFKHLVSTARGRPTSGKQSYIHSMDEAAGSSSTAREFMTNRTFRARFDEGQLLRTAAEGSTNASPVGSTAHRPNTPSNKENSDVSNTGPEVQCWSPPPLHRVSSNKPEKITPPQQHQNEETTPHAEPKTERPKSREYFFNMLSTSLGSRDKAKARIWAPNCDGSNDGKAFEAITPATLTQLTGVSDLELVEKVHLGINTSDISASALGDYLPNVRRLVLDNSVITTIRDLGTKLANLRMLSINNCGVKNLDGICALENLEELHASSNKITDAASVALHDQIKVLDLSNNKISGIDQLSNLSSCPQLETLLLKDNPIAMHSDYRHLVWYFLPDLKSLDGAAYSLDDKRPASADEFAPEEELSGSNSHSGFDASVTDSFRRESVSSTLGEVNGKPTESLGSLERVGSAQLASEKTTKQKKSSPRRPHTTGDLDSSAGADCFSMDRVTGSNGYGDGKPELKNGESSDASMLTHGTEDVFAGNPVMAMRRRKKEGGSSRQPSTTSVLDVLDELKIEDENNKRHRNQSSRESSRESATADPSTVGEEKDRTTADKTNTKHATELGDQSLVKMLRQRPKDVPQLKTRDAFQRFFKGIKQSHMRSLLYDAYSEVDENDRTKRVAKRMKLLESVLQEG